MNTARKKVMRANAHNSPADEKFGRLLVTANLTECHSARPIPDLPLPIRNHGGRETLASLVRKELTRGFASFVLTGSVLAACHVNGAVEKVSRGYLLF
jgi:hypothetical protein